MKSIFEPIITVNNNVLMKKGKLYLLNKKVVGTNLQQAKTALANLEKKQGREIKKYGYICTY